MYGTGYDSTVFGDGRLPQFGIAPGRKRGSSSRPEQILATEPKEPEQLK
jgi:hypothetical protein